VFILDDTIIIFIGKRKMINNKITRREIKKIIKEEIRSLLKEDNSVEDLVYSLLDAQERGNTKKAKEIYGVMYPRLASMGFDRYKLLKMKRQLLNMTNEKEAASFIMHWKLTDENIDKDKVRVYKVIIGIPFATTSNKDEKIKKLKYDLVISGVKILGIKELDVSEIAPAGDEGKALNLKVLIKVKTIKKKSELESLLEPDYSVDKIKNLTDDTDPES
tara:strand:- start:5045 stop:5698 length:654 start_codon:yes stop_codon:yes gene_type:complete